MFRRPRVTPTDLDTRDGSGRKLYVSGTVSPRVLDTRVRLRFDLADSQAVIPVAYNGQRYGWFGSGINVVAFGHWDGVLLHAASLALPEEAQPDEAIVDA